MWGVMNIWEDYHSNFFFQAVYSIDFPRTWVQWMSSFQRQCWSVFRYKTTVHLLYLCRRLKRVSLIYFSVKLHWGTTLNWKNTGVPYWIEKSQHVLELYPSHSPCSVKMKGCMSFCYDHYLLQGNLYSKC
jgi:hypothetical protein